jgi:hypothetical protein
MARKLDEYWIKIYAAVEHEVLTGNDALKKRFDEFMKVRCSPV